MPDANLTGAAGLDHDVQSVFDRLDVPEVFACARLYGSGHINDTYLVSTESEGAAEGGEYILQRVNHEVFTQPIPLANNVERITRHVYSKIEGSPGAERRVLRLVPCRDGTTCTRDAAGNYWRAYYFIGGARTYDTVESPSQAFEVARAFGEFQRQLLDLPGDRLHDSIPNFHDGESRFQAFRTSVDVDCATRVDTAQEEIDFALSQEEVVRRLPQLVREGEIPERVTHNDTKINNVLLDEASGEALCVLDLDTVMPGIIHYDFGDLVRTLTCLSPEDETDLSRIRLEDDLFEAVTRGYLEGTAGFLTAAELRELAFAGRLMTFVIGLRFLTDHLDGDPYFKVHRPGQNLDRARAQFQLVRSIAAQEGALQAVVRRLSPNHQPHGQDQQ